MGLLIDRKALLKDFFDCKDHYPRWICSICKKSMLVIDNKSFKFKQRALQRNKQDYLLSIGEDDPAYYENRNDSVFITILVYSNKQCEESASCCANVSLSISTSKYDLDAGCSGSDLNSLTNESNPKFFYPHLCLFKIPEKCPDSIKQAIEESFSIFFSSITATTNSVRISIEALLREHEIPSEDKKGRFISLHHRIENIPEDLGLYPFKEQLLTLKYFEIYG